MDVASCLKQRTPTRDERDELLLRDLLLSDDSDVPITPAGPRAGRRHQNTILGDVHPGAVVQQSSRAVIGLGGITPLSKLLPGQLGLRSNRRDLEQDSAEAHATGNDQKGVSSRQPRRHCTSSLQRVQTCRVFKMVKDREQKGAPAPGSSPPPKKEKGRRRADQKKEGEPSPGTSSKSSSAVKLNLGHLKVRGRVVLPPAVSEVEKVSDDEHWIHPEEEPLAWYRLEVERVLRERPEEYSKGSLLTLGEVWEGYSTGEPCPLQLCANEDKQYQSQGRFARHLVEVHLLYNPRFGCSLAGGDSKSCPVGEDGRKFACLRQGDMIRHLASSHGISSEKAANNVVTVFQYPKKEDRPAGSLNPKNVYHDWIDNEALDPLRRAGEGPKRALEEAAEAPAKRIAASSPTPPEGSPWSETPPEGEKGSQASVEGSPPSSPGPLEKLEKQLTPYEPISPPGVEQLVNVAGSAAGDRWTQMWGDVTRRALATVAQVTQDVRGTVDQQRREIDHLKSELARAAAADNEREHKLTGLKAKYKEMKARAQGAEDRVTNAECQAESLRRRYETADAKFIKVFGVALEVWDGSAAELQGRFKMPPPGSSDSE